MKFRVALIAAAMLASSVALAHEGHSGSPGPDLDRMAILLDLSADQKTQVQQIFQEQHDKMKAVHDQAQSSGTKPSREERQKFHEEMKQDINTRLQAVLSADQMKKFDALMDHGPRSGRRGPGNDSN